MNVLCLDTTSRSLVLALCAAGELRAERVLDTKGKHAEVLLPEIASLLEAAGLARAEVDAVGVTLGPGGFTSVRVGLATAKGLCLPRDRPLYGCSSLLALAWGVPAAGEAQAVGVVSRAYRGEVYAALYLRAARDAAPPRMRTLLAPFHGEPEGVAAELRRAAAGAGLKSMRLVGDGRQVQRAAFADASCFLEVDAAGGADAGVHLQQPAALADALWAEVVAGRRRDLAELEPEYVRPPDAALPSSSK